MKKFLALLLALVMVLALAAPAMAAEAEAGNLTITINGKQEGHTYQAYQIFAGDINEDKTVLSNITWGDGIDPAKESELLDALKTDAVFKNSENVSAFVDCDSAAAVAAVVDDYSNNSARLDRFAEIIGNYLDDPSGQSGAPSGTTYTISGLEPGYYLVKDADDSLEDGDGNPFYDSYTKFILQLVGADQTVSHKGTVPTLVKTVTEDPTQDYGTHADAGIGETVYFELEGTLPDNYGEYESYYYQFEDIMSAGLTFVETVSVVVHHQDNTETNITTDNENGAYQFNQNGNTLTLTFDNLKTVTTAASDEIHWTFKARVNENAVIGGAGNPNEGRLTFSNSPSSTGTGKTPPSEPVVYVLQLNVQKVDGLNSSIKLSGAEFVLFKHMHGAKEYESFAKLDYDNSAKTYKVTGWTTESESQEDATKLTTDASGLIQVAGLDSGTYHLRETKAPDGYNLLDHDLNVRITPSYTGSALTSIECTVDGQTGVGNATSGTGTVTIANQRGNTLPSTGGAGTTLFYVIGGILVAAAVVLLITRKRMNSEA